MCDWIYTLLFISLVLVKSVMFSQKSKGSTHFSQMENTHTSKNTYFLSRQVVCSQQPSDEPNVDLKYRHLGILVKEKKNEKSLCKKSIQCVLVTPCPIFHQIISLSTENKRVMFLLRVVWFMSGYLSFLWTSHLHQMICELFEACFILASWLGKTKTNKQKSSFGSLPEPKITFLWLAPRTFFWLSLQEINQRIVAPTADLQ